MDSICFVPKRDRPDNPSFLSKNLYPLNASKWRYTQNYSLCFRRTGKYECSILVAGQQEDSFCKQHTTQIIMKPGLKIFLFIAFFAPQFVTAQVKLQRLVRDSMILQRDTRLNIWGWAAKNEKINIKFNSK